MKKIISFVTAFLIITANGIAAHAEDDIYVWARETEPAVTSVTTAETTEADVTTTEITTTEVTTTEATTITTTEAPKPETELRQELDPEKEALKKQIQDLSHQLEMYGMSMSDLTMTIDELQARLAAATRIKEASSSSGGGGGSSSSEIVPVTEIVEVSEAAPQTQGNAELVEEVKASNDERQFITVAAKDGSVFYIVIDYTKGSENVYFLNPVDISDLNAIAYPDGNVPAPVVTQAEPVREIVREPVETVPQQQPEEKSSDVMLYIIIVVVGGGFIVGYYFLKIKPKKSGASFDDDDDYEKSDDFEEIDEFKE